MGRTSRGVFRKARSSAIKRCRGVSRRSVVPFWPPPMVGLVPYEGLKVDDDPLAHEGP